MDNLWNNLVKGLQEGAAAAADKAGDLTRLARARLDIAAAKNQLHRTQADLGARVHQLLEAGSDPEVQALNQQIKEQNAALADCEAAYEALQSAVRAEERNAD
ncbi:MAG: hypothetical protein J4F35_18175 [Candidatus Latescibacteria bacterium]|nr:hypothetical protein [Candidatus Latescibacterota bacterium]